MRTDSSIHAHRAEEKRVQELKMKGVDSISYTQESQSLRNYELRDKKRRGIFHRNHDHLASVLFPGTSAELYVDNEEVIMYTGLVQSKRTTVPFDFYDAIGCPRPQDAKRIFKNLGSRLQGAYRARSPYEIRVKQNVPCKALCLVAIEPKKIRFLQKLIERRYRIALMLDGMPLLMRSKRFNVVEQGFPVGYQHNDETYVLYNHVRFTVRYHENPSSFAGVKIVGFDASPISMDHIKLKDVTETCTPVDDEEYYLAIEQGPNGEPFQVAYSYDVQWKETDLEWADRWDVYVMGLPDFEVHLNSLYTSFVATLVLAAAIAAFILRDLKNGGIELPSFGIIGDDGKPSRSGNGKPVHGTTEVSPFIEENNLDLSLESEMQSLRGELGPGWQQVKGDVFRPPQTLPLLLPMLAGTGAQVSSAMFTAFLLANLGWINPMAEGRFWMYLFFLYMLSGVAGGYVSARVHMFIDSQFSKTKKLISLASMVILPVILIVFLLVRNFFLQLVGSSVVLHTWTFFLLLLNWLLLAMPLGFCGSFLGYRSRPHAAPTRLSMAARTIPALPSIWQWTSLVGGACTFMTLSHEFFLAMSALWQRHRFGFYYTMDIFLVQFTLSAIICGEVSILLSFLHLRKEDYRWWWRAYWSGASTGGFVLLMSLYFAWTQLYEFHLFSIILYVLCMLMISLCVGLVFGMFAVLSSYRFIVSLYSLVGDVTARDD